MQALREIARHACRTAPGQQIRNYKGLPVKPNPYVEAWYNAREDMEMSATITGSMLAQGFFWGILVPAGVYELIVRELRASEEQSGKHLTFYPQHVELEPSPWADAEDSE